MEIAPGVFQLEVSRVSNCFLIKEPVYTLVDCCLPRREGKIAEKLAEVNVDISEVRRLILTHWHLDHTGSAEALRRVTGMEVYLHPFDAPFLSGAKVAAPPAVRAVTALTRRRMQYGSPSPIHPLEDGQNLGGIQVVHTPGHTPGHVCLLPNEILLAGDALVTGKRLRLPPGMLNENTEVARESARKLLSYPFSLAVSGHGSVTRNARAQLERLVG